LDAEAYLSETVLVQNSLLELRTFRRRYAARAVPTGGPEKEPSRRGQAERLRETALRPAWYANHRPSRKRWGRPEVLPSPVAADGRRWTTGVMRAAAWRK
jgi:hypothetical protein